jgi:hypothetical protein
VSTNLIIKFEEDDAPEAKTRGAAVEVREDSREDQAQVPAEGAPRGPLHPRRTPLPTQASTIFNINYSTAKTLIRQHKAGNEKLDLTAANDETDLLLDATPRVRCAYREIKMEGEEKAEASSNGTSFYLSSDQDHSSEGGFREQK